MGICTAHSSGYSHEKATSIFEVHEVEVVEDSRVPGKNESLLPQYLASLLVPCPDIELSKLSRMKTENTSCAHARPWTSLPEMTFLSRWKWNNLEDLLLNHLIVLFTRCRIPMDTVANAIRSVASHSVDAYHGMDDEHNLPS